MALRYRTGSETGGSTVRSVFSVGVYDGGTDAKNKGD